MRNKTLQPYIWIFTSGFAFSWMAILTPLAGKACGWPTVAIVRCIIPLILITLWARWDGVKLVWGTPILWMRSLAGSCSLVGTFSVLASVHVTNLHVTDISTIANMFPIWIALLSWPVLGRFPSGIVWLSIASSIAGVALIQGASEQEGNYAALIVVAVSIFTAIAMLGLNRLKGIDPRAVVVHFSATALAFAVASYFLFPALASYFNFRIEEPPEAFEVHHLLELIGIGLSASVGQYFLTRAFTAGDPARVSVASLSQFVMVLLLDVLVLQNPLDWHKLWGIPLILGPTVWLMLQRVKTSVLVPEGPATATPDAAWAIRADSAISSETK
jgi:drug/metabolite transporter (DMT)-like permease